MRNRRRIDEKFKKYSKIAQQATKTKNKLREDYNELSRKIAEEIAENE